MYFITTKRMLEVCFSAHPNIQYRTRIKILTRRAAFLLLFEHDLLLFEHEFFMAVWLWGWS